MSRSDSSPERIPGLRFRRDAGGDRLCSLGVRVAEPAVQPARLHAGRRLPGRVAEGEVVSVELGVEGQLPVEYASRKVIPERSITVGRRRFATPLNTFPRGLRAKRSNSPLSSTSISLPPVSRTSMPYKIAPLLNACRVSSALAVYLRVYRRSPRHLYSYDQRTPSAVTVARHGRVRR